MKWQDILRAENTSIRPTDVEAVDVGGFKSAAKRRCENGIWKQKKKAWYDRVTQPGTCTNSPSLPVLDQLWRH